MPHLNQAILKIGIDMHTKESITKMLTERDDAVIRAVLAIDRNQTTDERRGYVSVHENGVGFSKFHAKMGMAAADHYRRYGYMTQSQLEWWKAQSRGKMRIAQYAGQLCDIANSSTKA